MAHLITREVNNIHRQGFGLDGASGRDFFEESGDPSRAASNMRLSDHVSNNLQAIAAAKDPGAAGDNRIAIALSAIGEMKGLAGDTNSSIIDVYNSMVSGLAVKTGECKKELTFQKDVLDQLQNVRESLVGVNLDEETANLLKFQHSYAASAKILQVADETTQTLLNTFK